MKLSTKGRYGLRAMVDITINSHGEHVALSSVAERQGLSVQYLEQVFSTLRKAGLIKSIKGAGGGYTLTDDPAMITVGAVLRAMEGDISIVNSLSKSKPEEMNNIEKCIRSSLWERIDESINTIVDEVTLKDLADDTRKLTTQNPIMFHI